MFVSPTEEANGELLLRPVCRMVRLKIEPLPVKVDIPGPFGFSVLGGVTEALVRIGLVSVVDKLRMSGIESLLSGVDGAGRDDSIERLEAAVEAVGKEWVVVGRSRSVD